MPENHKADPALEKSAAECAADLFLPEKDPDAECTKAECAA